MGRVPFELGLVLLATLLLLLPGARWPGWVKVGWLLLAVPAVAFIVADGTGSPSDVSGLTLPGGFLLGNAGLFGAGLLALGIGGGRAWHVVTALAGLLWLRPILRPAWPMVVPAALLLGALVVGLAGMVTVLSPGEPFRILEKRWGAAPGAGPGFGTGRGAVFAGVPLLLLFLPLPVRIRILGAGIVVILAVVLDPERRRPSALLHGVVVLALLAVALALPRDFWLVPGAGLAGWLLSGLWPWHRLPGGIVLAPVSLLLFMAMGNAAVPLSVRYWDVAALVLLLLGQAHAVAVRDPARSLGALALVTAWFAVPGRWSSGAAALILLAGAHLVQVGAPKGWGPIRMPRVALVPVAWAVLQWLQAGLASEVVLTLLTTMLLAGACLALGGVGGRVASTP